MQETPFLHRDFSGFQPSRNMRKIYLRPSKLSVWNTCVTANVA